MGGTEGNSAYLCRIGRRWKGNRAHVRARPCPACAGGCLDPRLARTEVCREAAPLQPVRDLPASKSKQIQIKPREKAWISLDFFGRIWTFQWVAGEKLKNSPAPDLASQVVRRNAASRISLSFPGQTPCAAWSAEYEKIYHGFWILERDCIRLALMGRRGRPSPLSE
jgi:hypothetical protein